MEAVRPNQFIIEYVGEVLSITAFAQDDKYVCVRIERSMVSVTARTLQAQEGGSLLCVCGATGWQRNSGCVREG